MIVKRIEQKDVEKFEKIGVESEGKAPLNLKKWLDQGRTKLKWCFVVEADGAFLGRIIYGVIEEIQELVIWQIQLECSKDIFDDVGKELLKESLNMIQNERYKNVAFHLYSSSSKDYEMYRNIFIDQGFRLTQEKKSYELANKNSLLKENHLFYKTLGEVGKAAFLKAIEAVTEETLDRDDQESILINGSEKAAIIYFELLKDIDFNEAWWRLAYDSNEELIGLMVPQKFSEEIGAINYIGVVPEKRGNGYINDLISESTRIMIEDGIQSIVADIDIKNIPLGEALERWGYEEKSTLLVLKHDL